ncbi:MAG: hypothetical protein LAT53_00365 [Idiomarina sp.]|nr:hypothetical protein [Idiomarina sp.]
MSEQLTITLSIEATAEYLSIMQSQTEAEVNTACEPSGAILQIEIDANFCSAGLLTGSKLIQLGSVEVDLVTTA